MTAEIFEFRMNRKTAFRHISGAAKRLKTADLKQLGSVDPQQYKIGEIYREFMRIY